MRLERRKFDHPGQFEIKRSPRAPSLLLHVPRPTFLWTRHLVQKLTHRMEALGRRLLSSYTTTIAFIYTIAFIRRRNSQWGGSLFNLKPSFLPIIASFLFLFSPRSLCDDAGCDGHAVNGPADQVCHVSDCRAALQSRSAMSSLRAWHLLACTPARVAVCLEQRVRHSNGANSSFDSFVF